MTHLHHILSRRVVYTPKAALCTITKNASTVLYAYILKSWMLQRTVSVARTALDSTELITMVQPFCKAPSSTT